MQHTDPDTCVHAQCTSRLGGWEPTSMYVLYMHVHMYLYLRADKARMCTRCTGSLGRYIGTRRRIVCVRACLRALRRAKKCQAAQARWWDACQAAQARWWDVLEIPAARVARRGTETSTTWPRQMPHPSWAQRPPSQGVYIVLAVALALART